MQPSLSSCLSHRKGPLWKTKHVEPFYCMHLSDLFTLSDLLSNIFMLSDVLHSEVCSVLKCGTPALLCT